MVQSGLNIGAYRAGDRPVTDVFTGVDAFNIDQKMDDGNPISGWVLGNQNGYMPTGGGWQNDCSTGSDYLVQNTNIICRLVWLFKVGD